VRIEAIVPVYTRIAAGHFTVGPDYGTFRSDGTDDWLLLHTLAGAGRFAGSDGSMHGAEAGQTTLITPGVRHDYRTDPRIGTWEFCYAHFVAPSDWRSLLEWPELAPGLHQLSLESDVREQVETNLAEAVQWSHSLLQHGGTLGLNRLQAALLWCDEANPLTHPVDERVRQVIEAVEQDPQRSWSLEQLAALVGLSPSRICHLFGDHLGLSPMAFVQRRRMEVAAELLDLTNHSVSDVAAAIGYTDPLYFSARFRRKYQMSPTSYRERKRSSGSSA